MTNMQLQRESLFSANLDTVPQREATTFDAQWHGQLPRRIAPHLVARKILGEGGTAIVFGAFHTRLKLPVAVKILKLEGESSVEAALRMHREAELCARLDSPRFPRIYDVDALPDGTPYVVMEEVRGRPLDELLSNGPLELDLAVAIVCEVLEGLTELHAAGVIHRDIKPSNLMLEDDPAGVFRVRMLDLGIAKSMSEPNSPDPLGSHPAVSLTQRGSLLGTPHYMSSEQLMGAPVDARTDLYSVGVLLYEMLSGRLPFQGETAGSVIAAALRDVPIALRVLRPDLPEELEYIVAKAMDRDRSQRFFSAAEMLVALRAVSPAGRSTRQAPRPVVVPSQSDAIDLQTAQLKPPTSGLRLSDSEAWAARALHSMPPEPRPRSSRWGARGILVACAVLAGVVAWPTTTGQKERTLESGAAQTLISPAEAPFIPALTQAPRTAEERALEHVDLLRERLEISTPELGVILQGGELTAPTSPTPSVEKPSANGRLTRDEPAQAATANAQAQANKPQPSVPHDGTSNRPAPPPGTENGTQGVSLNSYVEQLDQWLEPPPASDATNAADQTATPSDIPENPYR